VFSKTYSFSVLFHVSFFCCVSYLKVQELLDTGSVAPEWQNQTDVRSVDSAVRAAEYKQDGSAMGMIIHRIEINAVGVSTPCPDYLWTKPYGDKTRWCYSGRLQKSFSSSDTPPVPLYEMSEELLQIV
jgi:hypothetical protein